MDYSLQGSSVQGISQARILEWVAISFSQDIYTYIHTHAQAYTHSLKLIEGKLKKKTEYCENLNSFQVNI